MRTEVVEMKVELIGDNNVGDASVMSMLRCCDVAMGRCDSEMSMTRIQKQMDCHISLLLYLKLLRVYKGKGVPGGRRLSQPIEPLYHAVCFLLFRNRSFDIDVLWSNKQIPKATQGRLLVIRRARTVHLSARSDRLWAVVPLGFWPRWFCSAMTRNNDSAAADPSIRCILRRRLVLGLCCPSTDHGAAPVHAAVQTSYLAGSMPAEKYCLEDF